MMKTYLVTGVAGFIGSSIAEELIKRGHSVRGIDNLSTGKLENISHMPSLDFIEGNICDPHAMAKACSGVDCVFHEAAIASVPRSVEDPVSTHVTNVNGTLQVLLSAKDAGVSRVVYAGSSSAYGNSEEMPKRENMETDPCSPYAASKLAGEHYMQSFYWSYGLSTVVLRYFNVFGPRQDASSPYSGVLAKFISQMLQGERPTIFGDGLTSRDFTYIDNVVLANLLASEAPAEAVSGKVFNAATSARISLLDVYKVLQSLTGYNVQPNFEAERTGDVRHSQADISKAMLALGYRPIVAFEEGLKRTVEWYREQSALADPENQSVKQFAASAQV